MEKKSLIGGAMRLSIAKRILEIADALDEQGFYREADKLTNLVRKAQMPGQNGWSPNSAVGPAQQPQPPPQQMPQPQQTQQQPQGLTPQVQGLIDSLHPNLQNIATPSINSPMIYNGPQTPYYPGAQTNTGGYQGWYNGSQTQNTAPSSFNPQQLQQQIMNMPVGGLTVVKTGPDGKQVVQPGMTMQDYMNAYVQSSQRAQQGQNGAIQNARHLQIQNQMAQHQQEYWKLYQEMQNQQLGDGHPTLYK